MDGQPLAGAIVGDDAEAGRAYRVQWRSAGVALIEATAGVVALVRFDRRVPYVVEVLREPATHEEQLRLIRAVQRALRERPRG